MASNRCPECGSWDRECGSDTPVEGCGCKRCLTVVYLRLREENTRLRALLARCADQLKVGVVSQRVKVPPLLADLDAALAGETGGGQ